MNVVDLKVGMLFYLAGSDFIYAWLLDAQGKAQKFQVARWEDIFPHIDELFAAMEGLVPIRRSFQAFAYDWGRRLLPPIECLQVFDILVVIPHYLIHGLPLHVIWIEERQQFLGTIFGMTYCSSGSLFVRCIDRNLARNEDLSKWRFAIEEDEMIQGPQPPTGCYAYGVDVKTHLTEKYQALAQLFAAYFPISVVDSDSIPRTTLKELHCTSNGDAICIICHGYYDKSVPDESGLLFERNLGSLGQKRIFLHRDIQYRFHDMPFKYMPTSIEIQSLVEAEIMSTYIQNGTCPPPGEALGRLRETLFQQIPGATEPRYRREPEFMTIRELKVDFRTQAQLVALFGCWTGAGQISPGDDINSMAYLWLKAGAASTAARQESSSPQKR